jgi:hypothetical protein
LLQSPPAALRQGNARTAVNHVVDVVVVLLFLFQSPPAALSQGIAREAVDHVVVVEDLAFAPIPNHHPQPSVRVSRGRQSTM